MRICITRSERHSYSETFIRDQIAGISKLADVYTIHSGRLPERKEDGSLLAPWFFWLLHKIIRGVSGKRNNHFGNYGVKKYFSENKIEVVLANYGLSAAHLMPICRDLNIPLLVIFHGHDATDKRLLKEYAVQYKALFAYASSTIVVSQDMRKKIVELGADPARVQVVPCGVDVFKFSPSTTLKEKRYLAVGRFVNKKGPLFTIKAFHEVWKKHPDARLIMVGGYKGLYEACAALTNSLLMDYAVEFPGILKQEEIRLLMGNTCAFVQHSVTAANGDMEGTPVSILEAAASGLPIVSTLHGGIQDAVIHGTTGFLVKEGDVIEMAAYMIKLLEEPELAVSMGQKGRSHMEAHYDQVKQIRKLYELAVEGIKNNIQN